MSLSRAPCGLHWRRLSVIIASRGADRAMMIMETGSERDERRQSVGGTLVFWQGSRAPGRGGALKRRSSAARCNADEPAPRDSAAGLQLSELAGCVSECIPSEN